MRLTTTDAFFVAYQERAGILMHLGAELVLPARPDVEAGVARVLARWPELGMTLARGLGGLRWRGEPRVAVEQGDAALLARWRAEPIDPFREPPLAVAWLSAERTLVVRCHHAAADGTLFLAILRELGSGTTSPLASTPSVSPLGFARLWRDTRVRDAWRAARALEREAKQERSARLALRAQTAGPVATYERRLDRRAIDNAAVAAGVRAPWLVAAAWLRALHAWNARRGVANPLLSVEIPVSLRRGPHALAGAGNQLAVLTLFGDTSAPLATLARRLWDDYAAAIRRRDHLALPLVGAPARLLPWPVFRRVAVTTTSTGFATSHFTWIEHADLPAGRFYTPVCLRMGVALAVLASPDELYVAFTYRTTALTAADAGELAGDLHDALVPARQREAAP